MNTGNFTASLFGSFLIMIANLRETLRTHFKLFKSTLKYAYGF